MIQIIILPSAGGNETDSAPLQVADDAEHIFGKLFSAIEQGTVHIGGNESDHNLSAFIF